MPHDSYWNEVGEVDIDSHAFKWGKKGNRTPEKKANIESVFFNDLFIQDHAPNIRSQFN